MVDLALPRGDADPAYVTYAEPHMASAARRQLHKLIFFDCRLEANFEMSAAPMHAAGVEPMPREHMPRLRDPPAGRPPPPSSWGAGAGGGGGDRGGHGHQVSDEFVEDMEDPLATCRVSISDLDASVREADVAAVAQPFGPVESVIVRREPPGGSTACADVKFRTLISAVKAKRELERRDVPLLRGREGRRPR